MKVKNVKPTTENVYQCINLYHYINPIYIYEQINQCYRTVVHDTVTYI